MALTATVFGRWGCSKSSRNWQNPSSECPMTIILLSHRWGPILQHTSIFWLPALFITTWLWWHLSGTAAMGLPRVWLTPVPHVLFTSTTICTYMTWILALASAWEVLQSVCGKVRAIRLSSISFSDCLPYSWEGNYHSSGEQDSLSSPLAWLNVRKV